VLKFKKNNSGAKRLEKQWSAEAGNFCIKPALQKCSIHRLRSQWNCDCQNLSEVLSYKNLTNWRTICGDHSYGLELPKFTIELNKAWKGCERKWFWYNLRYYPDTLLEDLGQPCNIQSGYSLGHLRHKQEKCLPHKHDSWSPTFQAQTFSLATYSKSLFFHYSVRPTQRIW